MKAQINRCVYMAAIGNNVKLVRFNESGTIRGEDMVLTIKFMGEHFSIKRPAKSCGQNSNR
jgi:hypothetical protein